MQIGSVTSVNVPTAAPMAQQVAARPGLPAGQIQDQPAGRVQNAPQVKKKEQLDLAQQLQMLEAQMAARAKQAGDVNSLDMSYSKKEKALSVKVVRDQTEEMVREIKFRDYQASAVAPHSVKGVQVDMMA